MDLGLHPIIESLNGPYEPAKSMYFNMLKLVYKFGPLHSQQTIKGTLQYAYKNKKNDFGRSGLCPILYFNTWAGSLCSILIEYNGGFQKDIAGMYFSCSSISEKH